MSEAATHHRLEGLEPDNLLAFLALLGLLRSLELSRPNLKPRVYWNFEGSPLRPVLTTSEATTREAICSSALEGLNIFHQALRPFRYQLKDNEKGGSKLVKRTGLPDKEECLRSWSKHCANAVQRCTLVSSQYLIWRLRCDLMASFASVAHGNKGSEVEQTPLKLPSGQMAFIGAMYDLAKECQVDDICHALFEKWDYSYKGNSLRLSPDEAQRYAYRASNPSPEGAYTEKAASALSGLGMLSFPMSEGTKCWKMVGYSGTRREGRISWSLWDAVSIDKSFLRGSSLCAIEAMLRSVPSGRGESRAFFGSEAMIATARRFVLDPSKGDYGNISRARIEPINAVGG